MIHAPSSRITRRGFLAAGGALVLVRGQLGAQTATPKPMKIGIIGSGRQGGAIGTLWAKVGHQIVFSSRNPDSLKDLVAQAGPTRAGRARRPRRRASATSCSSPCPTARCRRWARTTRP